MRISKLESYLAILKALIGSPLTIDSLSYVTGMDCLALWQHLNFLMMSGLVEERISRQKKMFSISSKGIAVLSTIGYRECFNKVGDPLLDVDKTIQLSRVTNKKQEQ